MMSLSPPVAIHGLFRFPAGFLGAVGLAPVRRLFALGQSDFPLGDAAAEVNPQGNDGQSLRFGTSRKLVNFALVKQKLAVAERFMVPRPARHILRDVGIYQVSPAGFEVHERVSDVGLALAERLHFRAVQHQARFEPLKYMVMKGGGPVLRDNLLARSFGILTLLGPLIIGLSHNLSFYLMLR